MNVIPAKTEFNDAEHASLRAKVRQILTTGLSQAELGRQAEVASATLSQYLSDTYPSEKGKAEVAAKLTRWFKAREDAEAIQYQMPKAPDYQALRVSNTLRHTMAYAREMGRMVQIAGVPGAGKTSAARQYAADTPRAWYAAMDPSTSGVPTMLLALLEAMGEPDAKGTPQVLTRRICQRVVEAKAVLIVDECQHLSPKAIETLRAINDRTRVGMVLMGNEDLASLIGFTGVRAQFAQVSSRISQRRTILQAIAEDAADLARAWAHANGEEISKAEIAFCVQIAGKPGGLRNIEQTMEGAIMAARGAQEPLALEHLQGAFHQLSNLNLGR